MNCNILHLRLFYLHTEIYFVVYGHLAINRYWILIHVMVVKKSFSHN